jgi:hypothetical protein
MATTSVGAAIGEDDGDDCAVGAGSWCWCNDEVPPQRLPPRTEKQSIQVGKDHRRNGAAFDPQPDRSDERAEDCSDPRGSLATGKSGAADDPVTRLGLVGGTRRRASWPPMTSSYQGKLCSLCGKVRTANLSQGQPVCTPCQKSSRLRANAATEPARTCPVDGVCMEKLPVHDVLIDRCPQCEGIFLDRGELAAIQKAMAAGRSGQFGTDFLTSILFL